MIQEIQFKKSENGFEKLANGAIILKQEKDVVLALYKGEFVTWRIDEKGNAFWGAYWGRNLEAALANFKGRLN